MALTYPRHIVERDPVTDEVTYEFTQELAARDEVYVSSATDYDTEDTKPWSSYTVTKQFVRMSPETTGVRAVMDDGSVVETAIEYFGSMGNFPQPYHWLTTTLDAEGRVLSTSDTFETGDFRIPAHPDADYLAQIIVYDPENGSIDFTYTRSMEGGQERSVDYDAATGQVNYVYTINLAERSSTSEAYANGALDYVLTSYAGGHTLDQDYTAGALDYQIERFADGRMIVTDFDLLDVATWTSYAIAYSAAGTIDSVTVL